MRSSVKTAVVATLATLAVGLGLVASAATSSAHFRFFRFDRAWDHGRSWGLGLAAGLAGGDPNGCVVDRPLYDRRGRHIGQRAVDVCN